MLFKTFSALVYGIDTYLVEVGRGIGDELIAEVPVHRARTGCHREEAAAI